MKAPGDDSTSSAYCRPPPMGLEMLGMGLRAGRAGLALGLGWFCALRRIRIQQAVMAIIATATPAPAPMPALAATERPAEEPSSFESPALSVLELAAPPDDSGASEAVAAETSASVDDAEAEGPASVAAVAVVG